METSLVKIGNSRGIIIPKKMLSRFGQAKKFIIEEKDDGLVFFPVREDGPRKNWKKMFAEAQKKGIIPDLEPLERLSNDFDEIEWTW